MFPTRYFPVRHFAGRYFPPGGTPLFSFTANAILRALQNGTFDVTAVMQKPTSSSTTASAILQSVAIASLDANAILLTKQTAAIAIDAILREASTPFFVDAVLLSPRTGSVDLNAVFSTGARPYDLDDLTSILSIEFTSTMDMLDVQPTWGQIGSLSTIGVSAFTGELSFTQIVTSVEALAAALTLPDIEFTQTTRMLDSASTTRHTTSTSDLEHISFDGGVEETDDD